MLNEDVGELDVDGTTPLAVEDRVGDVEAALDFSLVGDSAAICENDPEDVIVDNATSPDAEAVAKTDGVTVAGMGVAATLSAQKQDAGTE